MERRRYVRPCSATNDNRIFLPRPANNLYSIISRQAIRTESAQIVRDAQTWNILTGLASLSILHRVFHPTRCSQHLVTLAVLCRLGLDDFGNGSSAHDAVLRDWGKVKAFGIDVFGDLAALGRVVGYIEGLDEDLIVFQRGQRGRFEGESLIGTREFREIDRLVGQYPLSG